MENENNSVSGEIIDEEQDYVQAINDLKSNTVPKEQYQKLRDENKKLLNALVTGEQITETKVEKVDVNELRAKLFNTDTELTNLEYVESALKLRKAILEDGGEDIFLPKGDKVTITDEMRDQAERVADGLQYCIDFADGDSAVFTARLQGITKDPIIRKR